MNPTEYQTSDTPAEKDHLGDYLKLLHRYKWTTLLVVGAVFSLTFAISLKNPKGYERECKTALTRTDPDVQIVGLVARVGLDGGYLQTRLRVLRAWPVFVEAAKPRPLGDTLILNPHPLSVLRNHLYAMVRGLTVQKVTPTPEAIGTRSLRPPLPTFLVEACSGGAVSGSDQANLAIGNGPRSPACVQVTYPERPRNSPRRAGGSNGLVSIVAFIWEVST